MTTSKMTPTYSTMDSTMTEALVGNCYGDEKADAWFPTTYNGGRPNVMFQQLLPDIQYALIKCHSCPIRKECLEEGLKPVNLGYGIWGGKFAGERIMMARERKIDYLVPMYNKGRALPPREGISWPEPYDGITAKEEKNALEFYQRISNYLRYELSRVRANA